MHNYGVPIRRSWDRYRNFDKLHAYINTEEGIVEQKLLCISEEAVKEFRINDKDVLVVEFDHIIDQEENTKYKLIVRNVTRGPKLFVHKSHIPSMPLSPALSKYKKVEFANELFSLEFSDIALQLANDVLATISGQLTVLHLRRGDVLYYKDKRSLHYALATSVENMVDKIVRNNLSGKALYLMTNEKNLEPYLKTLSRMCEIYTYRDFPNLKALVDNNCGEVDNNLLFTVEIVLLDKAQTALVMNRDDYIHSVRKPIADTQVIALTEDMKISLTTRFKYLLSLGRLFLDEPVRTKNRILRYFKRKIKRV